MTHVSSAVRPRQQEHIAVPITPIIFPNKSVYPSKVMHCDVVFGSPSMDCNGTGICKITGTNTIRPVKLKKKNCQFTIAQMAAGLNGQISLFFFREFLCIHLYRQHFRKGILVLKEMCPLPSEVAIGLNMKAMNLLAGHFAVIEGDGYFRVDIDCA